MLQPKLLHIDPDLLAPNTYNTNIVPPQNEAKLEESIRRNGMFKPVLVRELNGSYEIIGGEHRWQISKRLGINPIPIANFGEISDKQAKEISVLDNLRYGTDDTLPYAELLKSIGEAAELQEFIPFAEDDLALIFSSADIAIDDLGIDENFEQSTEIPEPPAAKAPKTHTVMRFKVTLGDAEKITALISRTQRAQGLTTADDLTNAGDALVHLLVDQFTPEVPGITLDEIDDALGSIPE